MIVLVLLVCENLLNVDADDYVKKEPSDDYVDADAVNEELFLICENLLQK